MVPVLFLDMMIRTDGKLSYTILIHKGICQYLTHYKMAFKWVIVNDITIDPRAPDCNQMVAFCDQNLSVTEFSSNLQSHSKSNQILNFVHVKRGRGVSTNPAFVAGQ